MQICNKKTNPQSNRMKYKKMCIFLVEKVANLNTKSVFDF